jgi:RHS repeat-associated protein
MAFLVDTLNPTGFAQVVEELQNAAVTRTYTWGLELISEHQTINSSLTTSYYVFDGHGSGRALTNATGAVTDTYDYDAFGNLLHSTGTTPNNYLYSGEQFDPDLGLYYNRARYLNTSTGRFWSMDTDEGFDNDPLSLHKYLYANGEPVGGTDPSGTQDTAEEVTAAGVGEELDANIGLGAVETGTNIKEGLEAVKLGLAAIGIVYGALTPQSAYGGVTYDFKLKQITGGDFPDVSFGLERRAQNPFKLKYSTIIRINCEQYRFRLKVGDNGSVSASGGLNIQLWSKPIALGALKINLGLRVSTDKTLTAQFEFRWEFGLGIAPGIDPSLVNPSILSDKQGSPNQIGLAVRSKALVWDLTAQPLSSGLSLGGDSTF